jgi:hypothetical protein
MEVHAGQRLRGAESFGQPFGLDNCCHARHAGWAR